MQPSTDAEWSGTGIDMTTIQRQLSGLWGGLDSTSTANVPVRTSMFNLVAHVQSHERADVIADSVAGLTGRRPSRVIILVGDRTAETCTVDARVRLRSQASSSRKQCYEEITLTAHGRAADHLDSVVIPLVLPELSTYLLWPSQPPFGHRLFHRLLDTADQLIVDSSQFRSPGDDLANLVRLRDAKQGVLDFNWARLAPWREIIAQFFDGPEWLPYADGILSVRMEIGGGSNVQSATAGLLLMLGWVASRLGWEPETTLDDIASQDTSLAVLQGERLIPIDIAFRDNGPQATGRLMSLELVSQPKGKAPARFTIDRNEDLDHAHVMMRIHEGCEIERVVPLLIRSDAELLAEELQLAGHDTLYDEVVTMASRVAGREVWVSA